MGMKRIATLVLAAVLLAAACGDTDGTDATGSDEARLMALALRQLVTVDTTFGPGHRFGTLLVQTSTDPGAGLGGEGTARPLTDAERAAIEAELTTVSDDIRWIDDPDGWRTDDLRPVIDNSAIVGVGEPVFDDDGALVPVSLWCGGLCGTWFDYRVRVLDGAWAVIGPEGPIAVS